MMVGNNEARATYLNLSDNNSALASPANLIINNLIFYYGPVPLNVSDNTTLASLFSCCYFFYRIIASRQLSSNPFSQIPRPDNHLLLQLFIISTPIT